MKRIYIYPTYTPSRDKSGNLYIKHFHDAFISDANYSVINRFWYLGIASMLFNLDADIFVIQWIDLIPQKRFGKVQFRLFLLVVKIAKLLNKKIIWVLHNKHAHNGVSKMVDIGMTFMSQVSSAVLVHSKEGINFFNELYPYYKGKCKYIPHPVYSSNIYKSDDIRFDYIVWGTISRRKNIAPFLHEVKENRKFTGKNILVCGKCNDKEYLNTIRNELADNITFINEFIDDERLTNYILQSKAILFTYSTNSLLSSGALIYSLNFCKPIIGPNAGSFADLRGIVSTYNTFSDIPEIEISDNRDLIESYIKDNLWKSFPYKFSKTFNLF